MADFITVGSSGAFQLESQPNYSLKTTHEGGQTVYYSTSPRVSSTINDGSLTTGGTFTFTGRRFFITQSGTGTQGSSASLRLDNVPISGESVSSLWVNAKSYGALGDGVADDTVALRTFLQYLAAFAADKRPTGYVPAGTYRITDDNLFGDLNATNVSGMKIVGDGRYATIFKLITGGSAKWFYNNGATSRLQFPRFEDVQFTTDSTTYGNGFWITSTGNEQGFFWDACQFVNIAGTLKLSGSVGNDTHHFTNCLIEEAHSYVVEWENPQAVNVEFQNTNLENIKADVFFVGTGGGGNLRMVGGDIIMGDPGDTTTRYVVNLTASALLGQGNGDFNFYGVKTELNSVYNGLVKAADSGSGFGKVAFADCNLTATLGGSREAVTIGRTRYVQFDRCFIPNEFTYTISQAGGVQPGLIEFDRCSVPSTLASLVTVGNGAAVATNTYPNSATGNFGSTDFALGAAIFAGTNYYVANNVPASLATGTDKQPVIGTTYFGTITLPSSVTMTGISYLVGSVGTGDKVIVALYDAQSNALVANSALAGTTVGTAALWQRVPFTASYSAPGPRRYWVVVQFNGTTIRFRTHPAGGDHPTGSTAGAFGTLPGFIAATSTFAADVAPFAMTY